MANIGDGFKSIFLAGIGAMAYTGEKGKEIIDQLVAKGEITLDQGRELNEELRRKTDDATKGVRESVLEAAMRAMSPAERDAFAAKAAEIAKVQNEADASKAEEVGEVEVAAETIEDVAEAVEDVAAEVEEVVTEAVDAVDQPESEA